MSQAPQATAGMQFEYCDRALNSRELKQFDIPEGTPWPDVLDKFVDFLGTVYGYDLHQNVVVVE